MNLFEVFVKIGADTKGALDGIAKVGAKVADFGKSAAKITLKATTAAAAGITALTTAAVKQYADYEQLVGGIETLFKESAAKMMKYADDAYKTAGLSANKYMETVTSFSASLLASVGGDTERAAEQANKAIIDISDNVNKLGTSAEMVQAAYRGFARANYVMLDNLALGFSGTKEGMEALLAKAEEISGVKFDISSYSDIVDAIHVVQTEMGITGTTAKEAATTISGSVASMKAAFRNLVVGLADDTQDFDALLNNAVEATDTALGNILPRVEKTIGGIARFAEEALPKLIERIPAIVTENAPAILRASANVVASFVRGFAENIDKLISVTNDCIDKIIDTITSQTGTKKLLDSGGSIVVKLGEGILDAIPKLFDASLQIIENIIDYALSPEGAAKIAEGAKRILQKFGEALENAVYSIGDFLEHTATKIGNALVAHDWGEDGLRAATKFANGFSEKFSEVAENIGNILSAPFSKTPKYKVGQGMPTFGALGIDSGSSGKVSAAAKAFFGGLGTEDLRKEQINRVKVIAATVKSGAKKIASTVTEISEETKKKLEKAQSEFISFFEDSVQDAIDLEKEYQSTLEKRKDAIKASYDIFDEVEQKAQISEKKRILNGYQLIQNMYAQNLAIEEFYANVEKLRARGASDGLVEEFIGKGVSAAEELKSLLALDDEDLAEYESEYKKRNEIAERYSNIQLEGLKNETQNEIDAIFSGIDESYNNAATTLGGNFVDKLVAAIKSGAPEIAEALKLATSQALDMNALVSAMNARLGSKYALDKRGAMA